MQVIRQNFYVIKFSPTPVIFGVSSVCLFFDTTLYMGHRTSVMSRWLDIGTRPNIQSSWPNRVNKGFIIWLSRKFLLRDTACSPEQQDSAISPAKHSTGFDTSCSPSQNWPYNDTNSSRSVEFGTLRIHCLAEHLHEASLQNRHSDLVLSILTKTNDLCRI